MAYLKNFIRLGVVLIRACFGLREINKLLYIRKSLKNEFLCKIFDSLINRNADIDRRVRIGDNLNLVHNGLGVVIHPYTHIGNNVKIYQQVTIGRGNIWEKEANNFIGFEIQDNVVLCAGARIICSHGKLVVSKGCIIGANAVLTQSTGENEIWSGIPAKKIGVRK